MRKINLKIKKFKEIPSTQIMAKELARGEIEPWTVILAEEQTLGYGRKGQDWYSPKGGLYFSVALPQSQIEDLQTLTILAAFIVAKIIKENFGLEPLIKLPNDVVIKSKIKNKKSKIKKVCGILTENIIGKDVKFSVMGIGLNTNIEKFPTDLKENITSIKIERGRAVNNEEILVQIIKGLKEQLKTISE